MTQNTPLDTEDLLDQLRRGDPGAFETIFRAFHGRVFATAYRLLGSEQEAEDVAQEVFLRLYLRPLPPGRRHNLAAWLLRVATNLSYNAARGRRRRAVRESRVVTEQVDGAPDDVLAPATDLEAAEVREVLGQLPERQVQLLLLRQAGLSYAELALAIGVSESSVGTLLARAERAFRERYEASVKAAAPRQGSHL